MTSKEKASLYQRFFFAASKGGIKPIADVSYSYFERPVFIINSEYVKLYQAPKSPVGDPVFDQLLSQNSVPSDIIINFIRNSSYGIRLKNGETVFNIWSITEGFPYLSKSVIIDGHIHAIASILCPTQTYSEDDALALDIMTDALAIEFSRKLKYDSSSKPLFKLFLDALLDGDMNVIQKRHDLLEQIGISILPKYCVVAAKPLKAVTGSIPVDICNAMHKTHGHVISIIKEGYMYMLFHSIPKHQLYSGIIKEFRDDGNLFVQSGFMLGLSNTFDNLYDLSIYCYQAKRALEIGNSSVQSTSLHLYSDCVLKDMLSYAKMNMDPRNYLHPAIEVLRKHPSEKSSELLQTLRIFSENMGDIIQTSNALNIHRNSLTYRLSRIEAITSLDLTDINIRMALLFSFLMLD